MMMVASMSGKQASGITRPPLVLRSSCRGRLQQPSVSVRGLDGAPRMDSVLRLSRPFSRIVGNGPCISRQGLGADVWRGTRVGRWRSRKVGGSIRAMGEETMWITTSSAVALVVALAAFAALGGYLLSMGVDNEVRVEEEKIEKLKEQGLYQKPKPTQYEEQGVGTRTRKRRITEE